MSDVDNNVIALMVLQEENKQLKNKLSKIEQILNYGSKENGISSLNAIREVLNG